MTGRMSNRDRIAHAALEADAARKEKEKGKDKDPADGKKAAPKKRSSAKTPKAPARMRIVWAVCGPTGATQQTFPYAQEAEARAEAERLTTESGRTHFVKRAEEPFS